MLKQDVVQTVPEQTKPRRTLFHWLSTWELYLIVLVAGLLRFYHLNTTEFDFDQADIFRMARDAFLHGLLPTTSNTASIGIAHPAGVIYLFMLPSLLSPDPIGGAILVALFAVIGIILTYFFTRHYYGRVAGTVAALLYATAYKPLIYARFIWQPNLMPPFVLLFLFSLFYGVIDRRKGWLFPALLLLGILYQMHETAALLAIPLVVAFLLSPGTFRWRDLLFAAIGLVIIFFPYLLWQSYTHFADLHTIFSLAKQHSHIDGQALQFYQIFIVPNKPLPTDTQFLHHALTPLYSWLQYVMPALVILSLLSILFALVAPHLWGQGPRPLEQGQPQGDASPIQQDIQGNETVYGRGIPLRLPLSRLYHSLRSLQSDRYRCGLIVLLVWQIVPVVILSRHAIDLHTQYFFMLLPGSFILIGIFFSHVVNWLQGRQGWAHQLRFVLYAFIFLLVAAQTVGSTVWLLDSTHTNTSDDKFTPYHNDLRSLKGALNDADTLALTHHLNHVYVAADVANQDALNYLNEQMPIHTPTTLFDATRCLVLPGTTSGQAVLLVGPHNDLANALVTHMANATLVSTPARLGGAPFHLYLVSPLLAGTSPENGLLGSDLQLLDASSHSLSASQKSWQVTRWSLLRPQAPQSRTTYNYVLTATDSSNPAHRSTDTCTFTTIRTGDQLLAAFPLPQTTSMNIGVKYFMGVPFNPTYGTFHLETDTSQETSWVELQTPDGKNTVQVS